MGDLLEAGALAGRLQALADGLAGLARLESAPGLVETLAGLTIPQEEVNIDKLILDLLAFAAQVRESRTELSSREDQGEGPTNE